MREPSSTARFSLAPTAATHVSISVVIAAYQSEQWIAEALDSVLAQTYPADEVIVVDDGSTDDTPRILATYGNRIRVIWQENRGAPAAFNRAFREATGDFVALCGSDDLWEPRKLEWQVEAIEAYPDVGVLFGHAVMFGRVEGDHARPPAALTGLLEAHEIRDALFYTNFICAPSVLIRRALLAQLGLFVEDFGAEDYEYWFRCARSGARFYYDQRTLLRWRQHDANLSARSLWMDECSTRVRSHYAADVADEMMAREVLATAHFRLGRSLVDAGRPRDARRAFRRSLRYTSGVPASVSARALVWMSILSLPEQARSRLGELLVRASRAADDLRGGRNPALP